MITHLINDTVNVMKVVVKCCAFFGKLVEVVVRWLIVAHFLVNSLGRIVSLLFLLG